MTEKRFWLLPMEFQDYYGEQRFVRDNTLVGEKSLSNEEVVDLLNELSEENTMLKKANLNLRDNNTDLRRENEELKQELFESEKDYLIETYSDNPTRRDEKIQGLKEEFKERFGDSE